MLGPIYQSLIVHNHSGTIIKNKKLNARAEKKWDCRRELYHIFSVLYPAPAQNLRQPPKPSILIIYHPDASYSRINPCYRSYLVSLGDKEQECMKHITLNKKFA